VRGQELVPSLTHPLDDYAVLDSILAVIGKNNRRPPWIINVLTDALIRR
jgi:hypothetical protein